MIFEGICNSWFIFPMSICIIMCIFCYFKFGKNFNKDKWMRNSSQQEDYSDSKNTSIEIIKLRYAKGEITKAEFEDMKKDLSDI